MTIGATSVGRIARLTLTSVFAAVFWAVPRDALAALPTICLFKRFAGIECYGCGMTRAVHAFVHGDIAAALGYNALVVPLVVGVTIFFAHDAFRLVRTSRP